MPAWWNKLTGKTRRNEEKRNKVQRDAKIQGQWALYYAGLKDEIRELGAEYKKALKEVRNSTARRNTEYVPIKAQKNEIQREITGLDTEIEGLKTQLADKQRQLTQKRQQMNNLNQPFIQSKQANSYRLQRLKNQILEAQIKLNAPRFNGEKIVQGPLYQNDPDAGYLGREGYPVQYSLQQVRGMPNEKVIEIINRYSNNTTGGKRNKTLKKRK